MVLQLQEMGHEPIRLNTDDIPLNTTISFSLPSSQSTWQSKITFQSLGRAIDLDMEKRPLDLVETTWQLLWLAAGTL